MGLKIFLERAGLIPKREESGIDSAFMFHGVSVYSKPKADAKLKAEYKGFKFHGEEAYSQTPVPKVVSTPAGAIDPTKAKEEPTDTGKVDAMLLEDPAISGRAIWNAIKSLQIPVIDTKKSLDGEVPSIAEQVEAMLLDTPEISGVSLVAAMKSAGLKFGEADSATGAVAVLRQEAAPSKYGHIDFTPPEGVQKAAKSGLDFRSEHGRGGTEVGIARARDLSNGKAMSPDTIRRMVSFFARHEVDKKGKGFKPGSEGYPSNGLIAWKLWGGDAGKAWAEKVSRQMDAADKKESGGYVIKGARFLEASSSDNGIGPTKFKVALIQEGLGNLRDAFYYSREALDAAVSGGAFEGKKCYADHPSAFEEQDRPERSVRDIIGHFENVHIEEAEDGSARLVADLIMFPTPAFEWARTLVSQAIQFSKKYPDRELVGLSINASGDAEPVAIDDFMKDAKLPESAKPKLLKAKELGIEQVRVVSRITEAVSTDLVTEPGCRGKILEFIENERKNDNG